MTTDSEKDVALPPRTGDDMICLLDAEQRCASVNDSFLEAFGQSEAALLGCSASDPEGRGSFGALIGEAAGQENADALPESMVSTQRWWDFPCLGFRYVRICVEPLRDTGGALRGAALSVRDLSDARLAQEALEESEQRFEDFSDIVDGWLWELDERLRFVYLSARFEDVMDMSRDEVLGRRRIEMFPEEDYAAATTRNHQLDLDQRRPFDDYHFTRILGDGAKRVIRMSGRPVLDGQGRFRGYRGAARDVTESREMQDHIQRLTTRDPLTGLVNRQEFLQRLQRVVETACADGSEHGLCYVDVDRFRSINDRYGHLAGDHLLLDLSDRLREQVRQRDTLARVGGNAFAILMEHCSLAQIERVAESAHRAVSTQRFIGRDYSVDVAVTIGVTVVGADSRSVERVLRAADRACYAAKSAGGDRVLVYGKPDRQAAKERRGRDTVSADA
jgi:diguanylate cyclase (GGDEF)-like protein/PAS domain S-box-containing protein